MFSLAFAKDAGERAIKTVAQVLLALFVANQVDFLHTDFGHAASVALGAAVISLLTSIVSAGVASKGTASLDPDVKYNGETK